MGETLNMSTTLPPCLAHSGQYTALPSGEGLCPPSSGRSVWTDLVTSSDQYNLFLKWVNKLKMEETDEKKGKY